MAHPKIPATQLAERSSQRWVKKVSRNTLLILLLALISLIGGFLVAIFAHDFQWFARSGAIVSALGVALISQAALLAETVRTKRFIPIAG